MLKNNPVDDNDIFKQAKLAHAYIRITEQMGPSAQLLAFINHDNSLKDEIGIECFDELSIQAQHEILLSKFKTNSNIGLEKLSDKLEKLTGYLIGTGAVTLLAASLVRSPKSALTLGGISIAAILGSLVSVKAWVNAKNKEVITYDYFTKLKSDFIIALKIDELVYSSIPSSISEASLYKLEKIISDSNPKIKKLTDSLKYYKKYSKDNYEEFNKSGWNPDRLKEATKWFVEASKKADDLAKNSGGKLERLNHLIREHNEYLEYNNVLFEDIDWSILQIEKYYLVTDNLLREVKNTLDITAENFEVKSK